MFFIFRILLYICRNIKIKTMNWIISKDKNSHQMSPISDMENNIFLWEGQTIVKIFEAEDYTKATEIYEQVLSKKTDIPFSIASFIRTSKRFEKVCNEYVDSLNDDVNVKDRLDNHVNFLIKQSIEKLIKT